MKKTRIQALATAIFLFLSFESQVSPIHAQESGRIKLGIFDAVVQIETPDSPSGKFTGTGFLVTPSATSSRPTYLVTNKHMIDAWNCPGDDLKGVYDWIDVYFYRNEDPSGAPFRATRITLKNQAGKLDKTKVFIHKDETVDIVEIDVDKELYAPEEHTRSAVFTPSYTVRFKDIEKQLTGVGDLVFALGYPLGISSRPTNHPIAKAAYLASVPGEEINVPYRCGTLPNGQTRTVAVAGKILIVDGLIVHGNSGSPVLLAGGARMRHDPVSGALQFSTVDIQNLVAGIVSSGFDGSGLSIVYSSDYIWDLLAEAEKLHGSQTHARACTPSTR